MYSLIVRNNIDIKKLNYKFMSLNENGIYLLQTNLDKVCWSSLSSNPNVIPLLEKNQDKID
jgi:hypothetical protein